MLKKVICLLLILACSAALFACGAKPAPEVDDSFTNNESDGDTSSDKDDEAGDKELISGTTETDSTKDQVFFALVNSSHPNVITTRTTINNTKLGTCEGYYKTTITAENSYVFEYYYDTFNAIGTGDAIINDETEEDMKTIYYNDGKYSLNGRDNWVVAHPDPSVINVKLELTKQNLGSYTISADGTKLTTKVSAADAEKILGIEIEATSDVDLTLENNKTYFYRLTASYTNGSNSVFVDTTYTYENISASAQ